MGIGRYQIFKCSIGEIEAIFDTAEGIIKDCPHLLLEDRCMTLKEKCPYRRKQEEKGVKPMI